MARRFLLSSLLAAILGAASGSVVNRWLDARPFAGMRPVGLGSASTAAPVREPAFLAVTPLPVAALDAGDAGAPVDADAASVDDDADAASVEDAAPLWRSPPAAERHATPALARTQNYLLVGMDRRPGSAAHGRADTIMVAVVDPASKHVGVISVPRDLYVEVPGVGSARLAAVPTFARNAGSDGVAVLREVIQKTLAIPIERVVVIDLSTLIRSVDLLGGITVSVPCPIRDNFIDDESPTGRTLLDVPAGDIAMDGKTAAMYARSRHGRSDWSRARRQQAIMRALLDRVTGLDGLTKIPTLLDELGASIESDLSRVEMLQLVRLALTTEPERMHGLVLGSNLLESHTTADGQHVLLPHFDAIDDALATLFSAPLPGVPAGHSACSPADVALQR